MQDNLRWCGDIFRPQAGLTGLAPTLLLLCCMQMTHYYFHSHGRPDAVEERPRPLWLLPKLHALIRRQAGILNETRRLLLAQELERVAREHEHARDGKSQLVLRLLQGLHWQLGPALKLHHMEYWAVRTYTRRQPAVLPVCSRQHRPQGSHQMRVSSAALSGEFSWKRLLSPP